VKFSYEPLGRPLLAAEHASDIHFSVSHSGEMVAIAFSRALVGVDTEHKARPVDADLLRRWGLEAGQQREFLQLWTRNEAYLKALAWVSPR
jgi:phosphopantetheinyl transferase